MYNDVFLDIQLPEVLSEDELRKYITLSREGDASARNKIIEHNIKLVLSIVRKKFPYTLYDRKELASVGMIGLIKAVDSFDITKSSSFAKYASVCIINEILMLLRKGKKCLNDKSLNKVMCADENGNEVYLENVIADDNSDFTLEMESYEEIIEVRRQIELLNDRDKECVKLYFGFYDDIRYKQREIAEMMGVSQTVISKIILRSIKKIKMNLESQELIKKPLITKK